MNTTPTQQEQHYKHEAAKKIIKLLTPAKTLSVSKLINLKKEQLNDIGKAARGLYEALDRAGMAPRDRVSDRKW